MHEDDISLSEEELRLAEHGEELVAAAVAQVSAPQSLRESIERERARAQAPTRTSRWRRWRWAVLSGAAVVVAGTVIAIALQSGSPTAQAPTFAMVEAAAAGQPTEPAPALAGGDPPVLAANVGELQFPDWAKSFGWTAVGRRAGDLGGRPVTTVFYRNPDGARLGYSVVSGSPLDERPSGRQVTRDGNVYNVSALADRTVITWTQQGHTCVIVGPAAVPESRLVELAASRNT
jgi:hypothetical protein